MLKKALLILTFLTTSINFAIPPNLTETTYIYYSVHGEDKIKVYKIDATTEELTFVNEITTDGDPYPLVVNNDNSTLYSGNWIGDWNTGTGKIQSFTLNNSTGELTNLNTVTSLDLPVHISLSKNENFLLSASFARNKIATQAIDNDGKVNETMIEEISLPLTNNRNWPHMIKANPTDNVVYATSMGVDQINQYTFNNTNGTLTALSPNTINVASTYDGPRHFVFHPNLEIVYFSNELNQKIMVSSHNSTGLNTTPIQEVDLLPSGTTDSGQKTSDINITPDGKFVYCTVRRTNHTNGTISAYSVNQTTGALTLISYYDTEKNVRDFDITPDGNYLIIAGESSGTSILYKINTDGTLTQKHSLNVGTKPLWVLAVKIDESLSNKTINNNDIKITPNPFKGIVNVNLKTAFNNNDSFEVFDAKGANIDVTKAVINDKTISIDLSNTTKGNYFLKITQNGKTHVSKLISI